MWIVSKESELELNAKWIIYFFLCFGMISCSESHPVNDGSGLPTLGTPNNADEFASAQKMPISCSGATCMQGVGILFNKATTQNPPTTAPDTTTAAAPETTTSESIAFLNPAPSCSGFLINDRVVATSYECIQNHAPTEKCSEWLVIDFPVQPGVDKKNSYPCKSIISSSGESKLFKADYAFFEIEPTPRKPLVLAKFSAEPEKSLQLNQYQPITFLMSQDNNGSNGGLSADFTDASNSSQSPVEFVSINCQILHGSLLNPNSSNSLSVSQLATLCEKKSVDSMKENSGSPVFNKYGEVVGILQSAHAIEFQNWQSDGFEKFGLSYDPELNYFNFTTLSCIKSPQNEPLPGACATQKDQDIFSELEKKQKSMLLGQNERADFKKLAASMTSVLPRFFKYQYRQLESTSQIVAVPRCALTENQSKNIFKYSDVAFKRGIFWGPLQIDLKIQNTLNYRRKYQADKTYVLSPYVVIEEIDRSTTLFELKKSGTNWNGTMQENPQEGQLLPEKAVTIPECTEQQASSADSFVTVSTK